MFITQAMRNAMIHRQRTETRGVLKKLLMETTHKSRDTFKPGFCQLKAQTLKKQTNKKKPFWIWNVTHTQKSAARWKPHWFSSFLHPLCPGGWGHILHPKLKGLLTSAESANGTPEEIQERNLRPGYFPLVPSCRLSSGYCPTTESHYCSQGGWLQGSLPPGTSNLSLSWSLWA